MSVASASTGVIPNSQSQAEIFKLKMDHFEEIFDWLSLKDLVVLSETCKRIQRIVGYWIKTNYAAVKPAFESDLICTKYPSEFDRIELGGLSSFLRKLVLRNSEFNQMKANQFKSLTAIFLTRVTFTDVGISRIKEILSQVEVVKIKLPEFISEKNEFFKKFLQFCINIKELCIFGWNDTPIIGTDNAWLLRKYPTLEHFELTTQYCFGEEISELQTFFQQNSKIKSFATNVTIILNNRNAFMNTELKLDVLSIEFRQNDEFNSSRNFLNDLYERGLFKQLHVYYYCHYRGKLNQNVVEQLTLFNGLTKLLIETMENGTDVSPLINLKQFCINNTVFVPNMETLAKKLVNLEFIQFEFATFHHLLPLIRYSPKLNTIIVSSFDKDYENILKINELSEERSKLMNARKITIYVEERAYLTVKWMNNQTNWSLIEIKRRASYDIPYNNFESMFYNSVAN